RAAAADPPALRSFLAMSFHAVSEEDMVDLLVKQIVRGLPAGAAISGIIIAVAYDDATSGIVSARHVVNHSGDVPAILRAMQRTVHEQIQEHLDDLANERGN